MGVGVKYLPPGGGAAWWSVGVIQWVWGSGASGPELPLGTWLLGVEALLLDTWGWYLALLLSGCVVLGGWCCGAGAFPGACATPRGSNCCVMLWWGLEEGISMR